MKEINKILFNCFMVLYMCLSMSYLYILTTTNENVIFVMTIVFLFTSYFLFKHIIENAINKEEMVVTDEPINGLI